MRTSIYGQHQIAAKGIDFPQVSAEFEEHAISEEKHMLLIAERISQLGGDADFSPATVMSRAATEFGKANDLLSMIREDLIAERIAVESYRKLIQWFGSRTRQREECSKVFWKMKRSTPMILQIC